MHKYNLSSRSLMDRMLACEAGDSGSTPDESTKTNVVRFCALVAKRSFVSGVEGIFGLLAEHGVSKIPVFDINE